MIEEINETPSSEDIVKTEDGSNTLISNIFGERYHSIYGAKTESEVVFIDAGLRDKSQKSKIYILEMGFGTGLNALLSWKEATLVGTSITYHGYEKFPIVEKQWEEMNYGIDDQMEESFKQLHQVSWDQSHLLSENFHFTKFHKDILEVKETDFYDVIYFDAFAPSAQEELWTIEIFDKMFRSLKDDGVLVTYCAKGYVKRNLKAAGFTIEPLPGPPGKREMTRARKSINV